jgi:hypothetical protein
MPRWRTSTVALLTLGAAAGLSSCAREPEYARNGYATRQACLQDYGPEQCSSGAVGGYYYGPRYAVHGPDRLAGDPGPGRSAAATGTSLLAHHSATTRGGFGATGRSYASSGRGG